MNTRPLIPVVVCLVCELASAAEATKGEKLYALHLQRLFAEKCIACHGGDPGDIAAGFDMRSREAMLRGGESFAAGSTKSDIKVEICSKCHPFFTGKQKLVDTAGRIERFRKKYEKFQNQ